MSDHPTETEGLAICQACGTPLEDGECLWHGRPRRPAPARSKRRKIAESYLRAVIATVVVLVLGALGLMLSDDETVSAEVNPAMWNDPLQGRRRVGQETVEGAIPRSAKMGRIVVSSDPMGADVYAGIRRLGTTPLRVERPERSASTELRISKAGFNEKSVMLNATSPLRLHLRLSRGIAPPTAAEKAAGAKPATGGIRSSVPGTGD